MSTTRKAGAQTKTEDEDVVFFAVKDMSHGIIGTPVDPGKGAYTGPVKA